MTIHDLSERRRPEPTLQVPPQIGTAKMELAAEYHMDVWINESPAMRLACTPGHLTELVVGRLYSEGLVEKLSDVESLYVCESGLRAKVLLRGEAASALRRQNVDRVDSCCTDNRLFLAGAASALRPLAFFRLDSDFVRQIPGIIRDQAPLYAKTHAVHSCHLFRNAQLFCSREDIGRHNALDKVIGYALLHEIPLQECMVYTTGRMPVDMVSKAIRAGIPVMISKTYPTQQAV